MNLFAIYLWGLELLLWLLGSCVTIALHRVHPEAVHADAIEAWDTREPDYQQVCMDALEELGRIGPVASYDVMCMIVPIMEKLEDAIGLGETQ